MTEVFKALSDENRQRLLYLLYLKELCVCELEVLLEMSQSNVSRHLNKLRTAGLICTVKSGLWVHYRLNEAYFEENPELLQFLEHNWKKTTVHFNDQARLNSYLNQQLTCKEITENKMAVLEIILEGIKHE